MVSDANVRRIPRESLERHHPKGSSMRQEAPAVEIGLNAAIVAVLDNEPVVLVVRDDGQGGQDYLPSGPFSPLKHRTFESGLRSWVSEQTGLELGYVEQLYSFGDRGVMRSPARRCLMSFRWDISRSRTPARSQTASAARGAVGIITSHGKTGAKAVRPF